VAYFKTVIVLTAETEEDLRDVRLPPRSRWELRPSRFSHSQ